MKAMRSLVCITLAVAMILVMALAASALTEVPFHAGSILIKNNDSVEASGMTFAAYKILDLKAYQDDEGNIVAYHYSVPTYLTDFYAERYNLDKTASDFSAKALACISDEDDMYQFAADVLAVAERVVPPFSGAANADGYQFSNLPLGYYVISDTTFGDRAKPVASLMLTTAVPNQEIELSAEIPPIDKCVDLDGNLNTTNDRTRTKETVMGDTITFVINTRVPHMNGYRKYFFIIHDKMSKGLTYTNNLTVTIENKALTEGTDYEVDVVENEDGTTDMEIVFKNFIQYNIPAYIYQPITISYTAVLNTEAELYKIPNTSDAYLLYSDDPTAEYNGEDKPNDEDWELLPLGETPAARTEIYTTALEILCTDPSGNRLEGAEFTLESEDMNIVRVEQDNYFEDAAGEYWKLVDGSYTSISPDSIIDGAPVDKNRYDSLITKYRKTTTTECFTAEGNKAIGGISGEDGSLRFEGLGAGVFHINEIKHPEGYNILTESISIFVNWNEDTGKFEYEGAVDQDGMARICFVHPVGSAPYVPTDTNLKMSHSLNIANDISLNYVVPEKLLEGYDIDTVYVEVVITEYEGNDPLGCRTAELLPEKRGGYYYFTLTELTALQMNDKLNAVLYGTKDGICYSSDTDSYSIATYALAQLDKPNAPDSLKKLCANLLRYGAKAQIFKGYRTDALADASMTSKQKAYLTDLDRVSFGNHYLQIPNSSSPAFEWVGKGLDLGNRVGITFRLRQTDITLGYDDWKILVRYQDVDGNQLSYEVDKSKLSQDQNGEQTVYGFTFSELAIANLRSSVCVTVYDTENRPLSADLIYSADTYGNGKTGTLGDVCRALFAYSDSAKQYYMDS